MLAWDFAGSLSDARATVMLMARRKLPDNIPWIEVEATRVGQGGQGDVFLVEPRPDSQFNPGQYAFKRLKNVKSEQARARFHREIQAVQRVDHPGVIRIIDASAEEGQTLWYYVMPYHGDSHVPLSVLASSDDSPFIRNPTTCARLIALCADALGPIHAAGIVHRDIKPANVLVHRHTFAPILLDFGCCQVLDNEPLTLIDEGVGT